MIREYLLKIAPLRLSTQRLNWGSQKQIPNQPYECLTLWDVFLMPPDFNLGDLGGLFLFHSVHTHLYFNINLTHTPNVHLLG